MIEILDGCLQAIGHHNGVSPNPFCIGIPEEIIIYKGNTAVDDLIPHLREIITKNCGPHMVVREETSREGYSSIHLVARLTCHNLSGKFPADYKIPIEVQIRTVFEDAWGEIDHKYGYAIRSGKHKGTPIQNPETVLAHLKVLKGFTDACMIYGEAIRQDANRTAPIIPVKTVVYPVNTGSELIDKLKALGVPEDLVFRFVTASGIKDEALESDMQIEAFRAKCRDAADAYLELAHAAEVVAPGSANASGYELLNYYARLNQALCIMSIDDRGSIQAAMSVLKDMESKFTNHPLLLMRIGQAYGKLGYYKEAILNLGEAKGMVHKIEAAMAPLGEETVWPDNMLKSDYEYILRTQPKLAGYYIWQQVLEQNDSSAKAQLFASAYEVTKTGLNVKGLEYDRSALGAYHNNLLYYAVAYKGICEAKGEYLNWTKEEAENAVQEHLDYLEPLLTEISTISAGTLDTLMNAYSMQKDVEKAKMTAKELKSRALKTEGDGLNDALALRYIRSAEKVIADEAWVLQD
jgi:tetratricopeptide (TPR) repeat protein